MSEDQRPKIRRPPFWSWLPKYIKGTRIRSSTAILVVAFVALFYWYLTLRDQFQPPETRGVPAVTTTVAPTPGNGTYYTPEPIPTTTVPQSPAHPSLSPGGHASASYPLGESVAGAGGAAPSSPETGPTVPGRTTGGTGAPGATTAPTGPATSGYQPDGAGATTAAASS